jgi:tetratricopeptide (TPR) repeat protein
VAHGPVGYTAEARPSAEPPAATPRASETSTEAAPSPLADKPARDLAAARLLLQHDDQTDPQYTHIPMRRHAHSRWLVFVVVLAAGGLLAATVGKRYLAKYTTPGSESAGASSDSRVIKLLAEGDQLIRKGNPQSAKQAYFKAHALANQDPRVLTSLARLEALSADLAWLKLRLLDPQDKTGIELTHRELGARVGRTERAVGALKQVAPEALATQQLMVHAQRLGGKVEQARAQLSAISKQASVPENAYVLAALDLAEASPVWSSIVHRLRIATASEGNTGQARPALIYALTRSGQNAAAQTELDKLSQNTASHPLLDDLRAFVKRHAAAEDAGPDAAATVDPGELPDLDTTEQSGDGAAASTDFRAQLKQAHHAAERGQLGTAERLYNSVLSSHPGNTEALAGLADIATRRNESGRASELYAKVLEKNPSYLPALIANADQKWAAGDKPAALELYRRILDQAGAGSSYGQRAARRIAQAEQERKTGDFPATGAKDTDNTEADGEAQTGEEAAENPPDTDGSGESTPHIDTTDLPEFNR